MNISPPPPPAWSELTGQRTRVTEAKHGTFTYHADDPFLGASLRIYGEWSEGEVDFFSSVLRPDSVVVEVGANIGALTVPLSRLCSLVIAFEPQPDNLELLMRNLRDNVVYNVNIFGCAVGPVNDRVSVPTLAEIDAKLDRPGNYGGAEIGYGSLSVHQMTLDSVVNLQRVDFIKIDVEGSELGVLEGAEQLIARCCPILYVENDRVHKSEALIAWLRGHGYELYWHRPYLFRPDNHKKYIHNLFGESNSKNMICIKGHPVHEMWLKEPVA